MYGKKRELKLNIGCGYTNLPEDWINIDNSLSARLSKHPLIKRFLYIAGIIPKRLYELPYPDYVMIWNVKKPLPFGDGMVKYVYTSHLIEHLTKDECEFFLRQCHRVLRSEGIIRIIVPDLQSQVSDYLCKMNSIEDGGAQAVAVPADDLIGAMGIFDDTGRDDSALIRLVRVLQGKKNLHKWMYDRYSLSLKVKQSGFVRVAQKECLDSRIEDVDLVDNPDRFRFAVCVEAEKV
jgi:predicted SAM-dependent methyltransferase